MSGFNVEKYGNISWIIVNLSDRVQKISTLKRQQINKQLFIVFIDYVPSA